MDLSDFMEGEKPISYEKAREYFSRDPSQKYVASLLHIFSVYYIETYNMVSLLGGQHMLQGQFWF